MSTLNMLPPENILVKHKRSDAVGIKNKPFRRLLTLLALKTCGRFYQLDGPCLPLSSTLIVKTGQSIDLVEGATMVFVANSTSIPVPRVHCSFVHDGQTYIVMDRIRGQSLAAALHKLSDKELDNVLTQLRRMIKELRALKPPNNAIQSCVGGTLRDSRIPRSNPRFGPFISSQEFHCWLREGLQPEEHPDRQDNEDWQEIKKMVSNQDRDWGPPVFTHGDLNPFNILVRGDKVVGIIDWEFAGWYPYYWEYTSAWLGNKTRKAWQDLLPKFLEPWPEELEMESTRQKWWGSF
ncbi:hypothetical protein EsDP_00002935 [Epichloe bromicola]|uniref:Aminoglycoside phosphotransferase domain-containing protein n=1 Tax=Epichloe bromicola TaxID=79588 RepID=A0ABQ0CM94_9HYPO